VELRLSERSVAQQRLACDKSENGKHARRVTGSLVQNTRLLHLCVDNLAQPLVACQIQQVVLVVGFALAHRFLAAETGIGAQDDPC
jgi:hypothetical protein